MFLKKYIYALKWQANPLCFKTQWINAVKEVFEVGVSLLQAIGIILANLFFFPLTCFWAITYPLYHFGIHPIVFAFKAKDDIIEKIEKKNEAIKKEREIQEARKSDEEADPIFYQDDEDNF